MIGWGVAMPFPQRKKNKRILESQRTTVMLRDLPKGLTRDRLKEVLDEEGFCGHYNFIYLPLDFKTGAGHGFAFVNLVSASMASVFWQKMDGRRIEVGGSSEVCAVEWSAIHQGLRAHVDRFRNSSIMFTDVPDERRPAIYFDGMRVAFPPPTKPQAKAPAREAA
jgi:RNA recognition motif-containing protein